MGITGELHRMMLEPSERMFNAVEWWQTAFDSWDVDVAVLGRDVQSGLIRRMKADPGRWLVNEDATGLIRGRTMNRRRAGSVATGARAAATDIGR